MYITLTLAEESWPQILIQIVEVHSCLENSEGFTDVHLTTPLRDFTKVTVVETVDEIRDLIFEEVSIWG